MYMGYIGKIPFCKKNKKYRNKKRMSVKVYDNIMMLCKIIFLLLFYFEVLCDKTRILYLTIKLSKKLDLLQKLWFD